jgi:hypothetical protein
MSDIEYSEKIETKLSEYFKRLFSDYFTWLKEKRTFIYEDDKVIDTIHYSFGKCENGNYYGTILTCRTVKIIDNLWKEYRVSLGNTRRVLSTFCADNDGMCGRTIFEIEYKKYSNDVAFIEDSVTKIINFYEKDTYPAIERMSYVEKLNDFYNSPFNMKFGDLNFNKLIIAKFSDEEYEKIITFLINLYKGIGERSRKKEVKEKAKLYISSLYDLDSKLKIFSLPSESFLGSKKHPLYTGIAKQGGQI